MFFFTYTFEFSKFESTVKATSAERQRILDPFYSMLLESTYKEHLLIKTTFTNYLANLYTNLIVHSCYLKI